MPLGYGQAVNFLNGNLGRFARSWRLEEGAFSGRCDETEGLDTDLAAPLSLPFNGIPRRLVGVELNRAHHHRQGGHDRGVLVCLHRGQVDQRTIRRTSHNVEQRPRTGLVPRSEAEDRISESGRCQWYAPPGD
jgi:hypothetical protein